MFQVYAVFRCADKKPKGRVLRFGPLVDLRRPSLRVEHSPYAIAIPPTLSAAISIALQELRQINHCADRSLKKGILTMFRGLRTTRFPFPNLKWSWQIMDTGAILS
jgi:hypothetical protein